LSNKFSVDWFENIFNQQIEIINDHFAKYRISDALMTTYKLVWDDFCSWYLELVKPSFIDGTQESIDADTYNSTLAFFEKVLSLLHPFTPFITEELWSLLKDRNSEDLCITASWPKEKKYDISLIESFEFIKNIIAEVRNIRNKNAISPKENLALFYSDKSIQLNQSNWDLVMKLANVSNVSYLEQLDNAFTFMVNKSQFFVPNNKPVDKNIQLKELQDEIKYLEGFLLSVEKKLGNEKFMQNAKPEVIAIEEKKKSDALSKLETLKSHLSKINA
jgi:valyl-tRNA synthetase